MLAVATIGLLANLVSVLLLKGHQHGDLNVRGAFLHLLQDTLSSVFVVLAALLASTRYGPYLDPAASLLVALLVLRSSWCLLRESLDILLEGTPAGLDPEAVAADLVARFGILDVHHLHVWELSGGTRLMTAHLRLPDGPLADVEALLQRIGRHLDDAWQIGHATLQPESAACASAGLLMPCGPQGGEGHHHGH